MNKIREVLKILFLSTAIIGVVMIGEAMRDSQASYNIDAALQDPMKSVKSTDIKKLTDSGGAEESANAAIESIMGNSNKNLLENLSNPKYSGLLSPQDAATMQQQLNLGQYSSDLITGSSSEIGTNLSELQANVDKKKFYSVVSANSSLNTKLMDDQTKSTTNMVNKGNDNYLDQFKEKSKEWSNRARNMTKEMTNAAL